MAKQRGIHQLKGKVGEMSYYQQKGVSGGLVRKINEGMSARVKTDEAYANTRLNNAEFKNANAIASAAFSSVYARKRGMMVTFAVANMTKRALEDIKLGSGQWGVRLPLTELDSLICDMLEHYAKGGEYSGEFGQIVNHSVYAPVPLQSDGSFTYRLVLSPERVNELKQMGIDGLQLIGNKCLAGEIMVDGLPRLFVGHAIAPNAPTIFSDEVTEDLEISFSGTVGTPASVGMSQSGYEFAKSDPKHGFYYCGTILPLRRVGNQLHVLQEYCTYFTIPFGHIPESQIGG